MFTMIRNEKENFWIIWYVSIFFTSFWQQKKIRVLDYIHKVIDIEQLKIKKKQKNKRSKILKNLKM